MSDADRLLDAIPIEAYIQKFVTLKRKGNNYWGLCPFHKEKTPSFSVAPDKGIFKCFGCQKGGNLITFVKEYERVEFKEALKLLSEYSGIPLERSAQPRKGGNKKDAAYKLNSWANDLFKGNLKSSIAENYLAERKLAAETISTFELGMAPEKYRYFEGEVERAFKQQQKPTIDLLLELGLLGRNADRNEIYNRFRGRLMFPIKDVRGNVIAFGGRILKDQKNTGKYVNSPESLVFSKKQSLYNIDKARDHFRSNEQAILVEGYFDVIGLWQGGIKNAVAPLGTAFTDEQARILKRYVDRVIIFFDSDGAGIEASYKSALIARKNNLEARVVIQPEGETKSDPFDLAMSLDQIGLATLIDNARPAIKFFLWYFFVHSHNIQIVEEKRQALLKFFTFVEGIEYEWERVEYLKEAASILDFEMKVIRADYNRFISGRAAPAQPKDERPETQKPIIQASRLEKETLALLLYFPDLWNNEVLLNQMKWKSQVAYLLYSFFRDRLKTGEHWAWQNLSEVISILPAELAGLLSGLVIEFDPLFQEERENAEQAAAAQLQRNVLTCKRSFHEEKRRELHTELVMHEKLGDEMVEELALQIKAEDDEIAKINNHLMKTRA